MSSLSRVDLLEPADLTPRQVEALANMHAGERLGVDQPRLAGGGELLILVSTEHDEKWARSLASLFDEHTLGEVRERKSTRGLGDRWSFRLNDRGRTFAEQCATWYVLTTPQDYHDECHKKISHYGSCARGTVGCIAMHTEDYLR